MRNKRRRSLMVNNPWHRMNWLQRSTASWLHVVLHVEHQLSPDHQLRRWLHQNARVGVWLLIPAVLVFPVVTLILWQVNSWLSMLTSIFGHLIILPVLVLLAFVSIRLVTALFIKR